MQFPGSVPSIPDWKDKMAETNPTTHSTVVGYFSSEQNAEDALRALHAAGFSHEQIGVAGHAASEVEFKENKPGFWQRIRNQFRGSSSERNTQPSPELSGSENPNFFNYEASDFRGSLGALSIPEERSRYFSDLLAQEGEGVLITVDAGSRRSDAEVILETNGADVGQEMSAWSPGETSRRMAPENQRIELYGEVLRVHRDRVQSGEVRLRKETVTETKSLNVPVTREELVLERTPVEGERRAPGAEIGKESEIRIPLSEERVSVEKEPIVREEVRAGKREVTDVESHDAQVRHEELKVEGEKESEEERRRRAA